MDRLNASRLAIPRRTAPAAPAPLSFAQRRLWYRLQLDPDSPIYRMVVPLRLEGALDYDALEKSVNEIVRRHDALRTVVVVDGDEPMTLTESFTWRRLEQIDISHMAPEPRAAELRRLIDAAEHDAFDLTRGPMLRNRLVRLGPESHAIISTIHHIACDGQSAVVWTQELGTLYEAFSAGRPSPLTALRVQYADFAAWQREALEGPEMERQLTWWKQRLHGAHAIVDLPTDRPRAAVPTYRGASTAIVIDERLARALRALSRREGVTLFMTVLTAFTILLQRHSWQNDILVSTNIAGRTRSELEGMMGLFVNALALRVDLGANPTFRMLLKRVQTVTLDAYDRDLPFEKLIEQIPVERSALHQPWSAVMLQFFPGGSRGGRRLERSPVRFSSLPVNGRAIGSDLAASLWSAESRIEGILVYNADLFDQSTSERFVAQWRSLLCAAADDPDQPISSLSMMTADESRRVLVDWDRSRVITSGEPPVHELVDRQAHQHPAAVALSLGTGFVTYGALADTSDRIAHALMRSGTRHGDTVAVLVGDAEHRIAGMLGALKASAAFGCLDPAHPAPHLSAMIEAMAPAMIVASHAALRAWPAVAHLVEHASVPVIVLDAGDDEPREWLEARATGLAAGVATPAPPGRAAGDASDRAYVAFTSGSTGRPKAIVHTHGSISAFLAWFRRAFAVERGARIAQWTPMTFDPSLAEILGALTGGATLCVPPDGERRDPIAAVDWLRRERVSLLQAIPSFVAHLATAIRAEGTFADALPNLRVLLLAGEPVSVGLARALLDLCPAAPRIFNLYGPTEAIVATCHEVTAADVAQAVVPAGRPIDGCHVLVLDDALEPCPIGVPGEVSLRGACVAEGYLHRPAETAAAFVPWPSMSASGRCVYRTGDIGRYRPDGRLVLMGRRDLQVKIRGMRVELETVEAALASHPAVREVAVGAAVVAGSEDTSLAAYLVLRDAVADATLRAFVKERLPAHMAPLSFIRLDALPRTTSGKIDRRALPRPELSAMEPPAGPEAAPQSDVEVRLAALWKTLLGISVVSIDEDFFERGGHSLLAVRLLNAVRLEFGTSVPLRTFLDTPTIAGLARGLDPSRTVAATAIAEVLDVVLALSADELDAVNTR